MATKRQIRISNFGDYAAIDEIDSNNTIVATPLYLKKFQQKPVKIRWDYEVYNSEGTHQQNCMIDGFIRFNGFSFEACYSQDELMSKSVCWWEPTEYELTNKSIFHFN